MLYAGVSMLLILNLLGGVLIKISPLFYHDWIILGGIIFLLLGVYGVRSITWLLMGRRYQLSFVYPLLGINYVLSFFIGISVFHEPFAWRRLLGALIILIGVALLAFSKNCYEEKNEKASI